MTKKLVADKLWEGLEPLLPEKPPKPKGGRPRIDERAALTGILAVLKSGSLWEMLPQEMGCASGMSCCWRRLKEWPQAAGCGTGSARGWRMLDRLGQADEIDWERASLDPASVAAVGGGQKTGPPTDKGKRGSKRRYCGRPTGHSARGDPLGGKRPRLEGLGSGRGYHRADPQASSWPSTQASEQAPRRQGMRLPTLS